MLSAESFFPGKGTPTTQIDMRRISDGVKTTERYRTTEQVERATVEEREHQFLYQDGDGFHFMNMENYDQVTVQPDVVGDQAAYLQPEMKVKLSMHEANPIAIELPQEDLQQIDAVSRLPSEYPQWYHDLSLGRRPGEARGLGRNLGK